MGQPWKGFLLMLGLAAGAAAETPGQQSGTFTTIDFPGASFTAAREINSRGDIVGRYVRGGVSHGFLFSENRLQTIDFPGASFTSGLEINNRGDIVGFYTLAGVNRGFLLSR